MKKLYTLLVAIGLASSAFAQNFYGLNTKSGSFLFGNNTSYIQTLNGLSATNVNNNSALEIAETGNIFTRNGNELYFVHFGQSRVSKYTMNGTGKLTFTDATQFPDGPSNPHVVDMLFAGNNRAYVISYGVFSIFEIDLVTMEIVNTIDLKTLERPNQESSTLEEMVVRDGKLFATIWYGSGLVENTPIEGAYVAVVDLATNALEKMITDDRTYLLGYGSSSVDAMFVDEKGDLYIAGTDVISGGQQIQEGGVLRIKKGETEFDPSYFFNLEKATGDRITIGLEYVGNGIAYTAAQYRERVNFLDPFSKYFDATFKYFKVNVITQTAELLTGTPFTKGFFYTWMTPFGNKYLIPIGGPNNQNEIWLLDVATNSATKMITLDSEPFGLFPMNGMAVTGIVENTSVKELNVFPNPIQNSAAVAFTYSGQKSEVAIHIYTTNGAYVKQLPTQKLKNGVNTLVLDLGDLVTGNYILSIDGASLPIVKL